MDSKSVLIVEDDPDIRFTLETALQLEGFSTCSAKNGLEGLDCLRKMTRPSVIVLDLMMPIMNGWEFLRALRADASVTAIPVIVVTACHEKGDQLDVDAFIQKPLDFKGLLAIVKSLCQGRRSPAALSAPLG